MSAEEREKLAAELKRAMAFLNESPAKRVVRSVPVSTPAETRPPDPALGREIPISFTPALLDAILAGRKTQTRRPIRPVPLTVEDGIAIAGSGDAIEPLCAVGDRLWVREKWARIGGGSDARFVYERDGAERARWISSRYMPRITARTFLTVTRATPCRLMAITPQEAIAEGIDDAADPVASFLDLWDSIYGRTEFAARTDPWVWVVEFTLRK